MILPPVKKLVQDHKSLQYQKSFYTGIFFPYKSYGKSRGFGRSEWVSQKSKQKDQHGRGEGLNHPTPSPFSNNRVKRKNYRSIYFLHMFHTLFSWLLLYHLFDMFFFNYITLNVPTIPSPLISATTYDHVTAFLTFLITKTSSG